MTIENIDNHILELLEAFSEKRISTDELKELRAWCDADDEHKAIAREIIECVFTMKVISHRNDFDTKSAFKRFMSHVESTEKSEPKAQNDEAFGMTSNGVSRRKTWRWVAVAASIVLVFGLMSYVFHRLNSEISETADVVLRVPNGSQLSVTMSDGTKVLLNSGSVMSYSPDYGIKDREITLQGEGYFVVAHDEEKPFTIHTNDVTVRDIGTEFHIRNYKEDEHARVNLVEGSVALRSDVKKSGREVLLKKGQKADVDKRTGVIEKAQLTQKKEKVIAMQTLDEIAFDDTSLENIAKELSRSYGVQIKVSDDALQKRFYGTFSRRNNSVEEILETIASTRQMKYKKENGEYLLY